MYHYDKSNDGTPNQSLEGIEHGVLHSIVRTTRDVEDATTNVG